MGKKKKKTKNPKYNFHQGSSRPHGTCGSQNETLAWSGQGLLLGSGCLSNCPMLLAGVLKEASAGFYDTGAEASGSVPLVCLLLGPKP